MCHIRNAGFQPAPEGRLEAGVTAWSARPGEFSAQSQFAEITVVWLGSVVYLCYSKVRDHLAGFGRVRASLLHRTKIPGDFAQQG